MTEQTPIESARTLAGPAGGTHEMLESTTLLIDAKATARLLAVSPRTLWTLTNCSAIPSNKIGRSVRYCPEELRAWIAAGCPTEPGSAARVRKELGR